MSNSTRIAKNTLMLYFRHFLILIVGLYTVRKKLEILGVEDFGIYNVVGGIVLTLSFLNTAMTNATQRFLNVAMGKNDSDETRNVFSLSLIIHFFLAVIILILAETIGLWFFYNILNIPEGRMDAAFWVYQFSIISTFLTIISIPYRALIISYEKMSFFAITSIVEVLLKLSVVFLLMIVLYDKLIFYSILITAVSLIIFLMQKLYCNRYFESSHFRICNNKILLKDLTSFSGWNIFQSFSNVCNNQGSNIIINIFHGVALNAAMGIGNQVNSAVNAFASNFQVAFKPQLMKSYAAKDFAYFKKMIFFTSKFSFLLSFIFILPLIINTDFVLSLWLVTVPEYAVIFTQLILIHSIEKVLSNPLSTAIQAYGKIKKYSIITSILTFANLPLSLIFLYLGFSPSIILIIRVFLAYSGYTWRLFYVKINLDISFNELLQNIIFPILIVSIIAILPVFLIKNIFIDWNKLLLTCFVSTVNICLSFYIFGLNKDERSILLNKIKNKIIEMKNQPNE